MHLLIGFIGSTGAPTANVELHDILAKTFSEVDKMLVGKKFRMNLRALG